MQGRASGTSERKVYDDVFTLCFLFRLKTAPVAQPQEAPRSDVRSSRSAHAQVQSYGELSRGRALGKGGGASVQVRRMSLPTVRPSVERVHRVLVVRRALHRLGVARVVPHVHLSRLCEDHGSPSRLRLQCLHCVVRLGLSGVSWCRGRSAFPGAR